MSDIMMDNPFLTWNSVLKKIAAEVNSKPEAEHLRPDPGKLATGSFGSGEAAWKGRWLEPYRM